MSANDIVAVFGETAGGLTAGQVDDHAWLAVPCDGGFQITSGWKLRTPMAEWTPQDFWGCEKTVKDLAAFRTHVEEAAEHRRQLRRLGRRSGQPGASTPWGRADHAEIYGPGVVFHGTPSHGGIKLDAARNAAMPAALRVRGGWYEEDCEWAKVAVAFPDLFTDYERRHADDTLRHWYPDCWEAVHGRALGPGDSREKDRLRFLADHAGDWIVVSASRCKIDPGMVECIATLGGDHASREARCYRVPVDEYTPGPDGFVIDETRHRRLDDETTTTPA